MRLRAKLRRIVSPPPVPPSNLPNTSNPTSMASHALKLQLAKSIPYSVISSTQGSRIHTMTLHPSEPICAYILESDSTVGLARTIVVQHLHTRSVLSLASLGDIAAMLYDFDVLGATAAQKQASVLKSLGDVIRMDFFDPATLYWSGMTCSRPKGSIERWHALSVQFQSRVVVLNLRNGPSTHAVIPTYHGDPYSPVLCHLTQEGLGGAPSSNALSLMETLLLLGCTDGTLKCFDWRASQVIKSIKGLGKNDWIIQLLPANPFHNTNSAPIFSASTANIKVEETKSIRRVLALTRKTSIYLIEVVVQEDTLIDIRPPLARFEGVVSSPSTSDAFEHAHLQYDASRDYLFWFSTHKQKKVTVWDLSSVVAKEKSVAKPNPLLTIHFPFEAATQVTIVAGWLHPGLPLDSITCGTVTQTGDFIVMAAPIPSSSQNSTVKAIPIYWKSFTEMIQSDTGHASINTNMQVFSMGAPHLLDSTLLVFGTNLGLLLVHMESDVKGSRHAYFSASFGSMGRSILRVEHSKVIYQSLPYMQSNPYGKVPLTGNAITVYESPVALHLPPDVQKRSVRSPPSFLPSPSNQYLCLFWTEEMRYEILHVATVLKRVSAGTGDNASNYSPLVASGTGVMQFAWVGDDDVFSLLHSPAEFSRLLNQTVVDVLAITASKDSTISTAKLVEIATNAPSNLIGAPSKLKDLATSATKAATSTASKVTVGTTKVVASTLTTSASMVASSATKVATTSASVVTGTASMVTSSASKVAKVATLGIAAPFKKSKRRSSEAKSGEINITPSADPNPMTPPSLPGMKAPEFAPPTSEDHQHPWVELRVLVGVSAGASEISGSIAAATSTNLGELSLRGGATRSPPTALFGGPVLCVASRADENDQGVAYFYTRKKNADDEDNRASNYVASGPALPYPDLISWDDDGRLCAIVVRERVAVYLSESPDFVLLGTAHVGSPTDPDAVVASVKFLHGVLYCSTQNSVKCIFLGDLEGGICHIDSYILASTHLSTLPVKNTDSIALSPPTLPLPLNQPIVLGYQNGSLLLSTVTGIQAIPLSHPLLRIGALIGAGQPVHAVRWFDAFPETHHERLASFLDRRGCPEQALELSGLSLETLVDFCLRYGYTRQLEDLVDLHGATGLRAIDMGRGVSSGPFGGEDGFSVLVCVGAYLLSEGKAEKVRQLATECLQSGNCGKRDALILACLLLSLDGTDARRLMQRAVTDIESSDWLMGTFVRDHILAGALDLP